MGVIKKLYISSGVDVTAPTDLTPDGSAGGLDAPTDSKNYSFTTSVAASALTINLKSGSGGTPSGADPCRFSFRSATAATGTYTAVEATAATSIVVTSGATLGQIDGAATYFYVYALNNAGTVELAVSTRLFDTGSIVSTTAMSSSADSKTVMYSTTARTNVACRVIARMSSTQTTAGTWAAVPTEISLGNSWVNGGELLTLVTGVIGSTTSGNILIYPTINYDSAPGAYSTGTGRYTVPTPGIYRVSVGGQAGAATITYNIYQNGSLARHIALSDTTVGSGYGSGIVGCRTGDLLDVRPNGTTTCASTNWAIFERVVNG